MFCLVYFRFQIILHSSIVATVTAQQPLEHVKIDTTEWTKHSVDASAATGIEAGETDSLAPDEDVLSHFVHVDSPAGVVIAVSQQGSTSRTPAR